MKQHRLWIKYMWHREWERRRGDWGDVGVGRYKASKEYINMDINCGVAIASAQTTISGRMNGSLAHDVVCKGSVMNPSQLGSRPDREVLSAECIYREWIAAEWWLVGP